MLRKIIVTFFAVMLLSSSLVSFASNEGDENESSQEVTKDEFINLIKDTSEYNEYESNFVYQDPKVVNPLLDENEEQFGWIAQYEVDLNKGEEIDGDIQFNSVLTFMYSFEDEEFGVFYTDYSEIHNTEELTYTNLRTGEENSVDISGTELNDIVEETEKSAQEKLNSTNSDVSPMAEMCWVCFEYEEAEQSLDGECTAIIGAACTVPNFHFAGRALCAGGSIISCWVPDYRTCVDGDFQPVCP
ncbi:hypothetical protein [Alkalibacillus haloalkaliphilus]|uniref:Uncharacterized protein n=1 Tax=Alkalibacillus haloalkaliphilus TaxID=94136 RepID=A0A511W7X9_9BACI|nr:hypothetical protein [Alkalibacillus haloalkaliphilus]GEN47190.1 hypothetical protein AHA02nite_29660 [Alkalibacillus haloalkaliphilus]